MKPKYNDGNLTLCYMDMDSLIYSIETDDFYTDGDVKDRFDTSSYTGLTKDELGGEIMTEFVTLRPKMHAYKAGGSESTAGWDKVKKCNGIKKCIVRKMISFEDSKNCLLSGEASYRTQ